MQIYICIIKLTPRYSPAIIFTIMTEFINWESSYAIAQALKNAHPHINMEQVSLRQVFEWAIALPTFDDDPALANDDILLAIFQDWFEETIWT